MRVSEELMIDFRELLGQHTGENMAEVVWDTFVRYGIEKRVSHLVIQVNTVLTYAYR